MAYLVIFGLIAFCVVTKLSDLSTEARDAKALKKTNARRAREGRPPL